MSCPHHIQIYASNPRSYRDLPICYYETTTVYRDEKSGELGGLNRVRSATQDDAHVFCTMDQVEEELEKIVEMVKTMYRLLDLQFKLRLSFRDSKDTSHYLGTNEQWKQSQEIMEKVAKKSGLEYFVAEGEAAFYAPKIDIMATDSQGREWQVATEQLDFVQPARFKISYVAPDGTEKTPIMIHKALLGSIERFLSVYIEHTQGSFPFWLAPVQVAVLPVSEKHNEKAQEVFQELLKVDMRVEINGDDKPLGAKIRETTLQKVPFMIIIGDKEMQESELSVAVRSREGKDLGLMKVKEFIKTHLQSI